MSERFSDFLDAPLLTMTEERLDRAREHASVDEVFRDTLMELEAQRQKVQVLKAIIGRAASDGSQTPSLADVAKLVDAAQLAEARAVFSSVATRHFKKKKGDSDAS